jgi:hypothetical protein
MDSERYKKAIRRNLAELQWATIHRTTLLGIESVHDASHYFLYSAYNGLFNDYIAHCIKVFEQGTRHASFWYIYKTNEKRVNDFVIANKIDLSALNAVSGKLKLIRDKTHFHIDSDGVLDTKKIWAEAGLTGAELAATVDNAWKILTHLQQLLGLREICLPSYTVVDAAAAAKRVEE